MIRAALVPLLLALSACATPTLQQRADAWRAYQGATRATCLLGMTKDPAMPREVEAWCMEVIGP